MGATAQHIGFLISIPSLVSSLAEIKAPDFISRFKSRTSLISTLMLIQALLWVGMISIAVVGEAKMTYLIILFTAYLVIEALIFPAWGSLMSDLIPENKRGTFFGWRGRLVGIVGLFSVFTAGLILDNFGRTVFTGFIIIFLVAFLTRGYAAYYMSNMYEPKIKPPRNHINFRGFMKHLKDTNFGRFILANSFMKFAQSMAGPFFVLYMLNDLQFSYLQYSLIVTVTAVANFMAVKTWGRLADRYGNMQLLKLASILVGFVPLLWLVSTYYPYLIVVSLFAGMSWSGYELTRLDFMYDNTVHNKRERIIAYTNVFNGIAIFIGAIIGGFIATRLPFVFTYKLLTLFLISGILRLIAAVLMARVKEVRPKVKKTKKIRLLMRVSGVGYLYEKIARDFRYGLRSTHEHKT